MSKPFDQVEAFAAAAARHQKLERTSVVFVVLCGVLLFAAFLVSSDDFKLGLMVLAILSFALGSVVGLSMPSLRCPACKGHVEASGGSYCPQCGYATLVKHPKLFGLARCTTCKIDIVTGPDATRQHKIHACTHCGCLLHPKGM